MAPHDTASDDDEASPERWADVLEDRGVMDVLPVDRRKFLALAHGFGGASALTALTGCVGGDGGTPEPETVIKTRVEERTVVKTPSGDPDLVRVSSVPVNGTLPIYIGQAEGYFAERNIEVEVTQAVSGSKATAQLATGQLEGTAGATGASTMNAIAQGVGIKAVGARTQILPDRASTLVFLAREEVYEEGMDLEDAAGMTWATNATSSVGHHHVARALKAHGLTFDDITLQTLPFPQMISALDSGAIDIAQEVGALANAAKVNANAKHVEFTGVTSPRSQVAFLQFGEPFINQRRETAVKFLEAYILGIRDMYEYGPFSDRVATIWENATGQPPAILRGGVPAWASKNGRLNEESLLRQQEFWKCLGDQDEIIPKRDLVDNDLRMEALETIGTVDESEEYPSVEQWEQWKSEVDVPFPEKRENHPPSNDGCGGGGIL